MIGYYARRIAQDVKLPSQFSVLAPKVREFLAKKAFGEPVNLDEPAMLKAISSNVAQYVTIKTFVEALRKLVLSELEPQLLHAGRGLSETPPFPWSRPTMKASKCVFNLVPCDNEFEKEFAQFLEKPSDVERFAKLPEQFGFAIEYTDNAGNFRHYEPDFVVLTNDGTHHHCRDKRLGGRERSQQRPGRKTVVREHDAADRQAVGLRESAANRIQKPSTHTICRLGGLGWPSAVAEVIADRGCQSLIFALSVFPFSSCAT